MPNHDRFECQTAIDSDAILQQANLEDIRKQEETLQKLNAKTWGVEFVQDGNRKFLVLPYGKSAEVIPFQGKEWVHLKE